MSEGHGGPQFHGTWLADRSQPLPGTTKHPQGRMFAPIGNRAGDPWKQSPENWLRQSDTPSHNDIITWHASESSQLARYDDADSRQLDQYDFEGADWDNHEIDEEGNYNEDYTDFSVDAKDRPMADYGSAIGMHFGDPGAAGARPGSREWVHPARIPQESLVQPPRGNFATDRPGGSIAAGPYKSHTTIYNSETGESTPDTRWSDPAANFADKATDLVESGKTIAYRNDVEMPGSTSYRTLPETTRTWGEDVLEDKTAHPAMRAAAEQGFNPVMRSSQKTPAHLSTQLSIPFQRSEGLPMHPPPEVQENNNRNRVHMERSQAFSAGRLWSLQRPSSQDRWE